ncbi:MAG TPA: SGNH/GDSL hydrolase family protein [Flavitalea sp.]|nr:SGNH/GDSL hydrolase family protein [Flavitalea sp.]
MRNVLLIALVIIAGSFSMVQKKQKVVFFGDSITQAGVEAGGYITVLRDLLEKKGMKDSYELVGAGIGGNKVYDLYLRLEDDVLSKNPDIVVIWVGVNDVWHKRTFGTGTDPDKFEKFYHAIIKKFTDKNIKVMICTPAAIGEKTDFSNQLDGDLNQYSTIIRQIGATDKVPVIDLRKAFLDYNLQHNKENKDRDVLTSDGVHLNATGNQFVADKMFEALTGKKG